MNAIYIFSYVTLNSVILFTHMAYTYAKLLEQKDVFT